MVTTGARIGPKSSRTWRFRPSLHSTKRCLPSRNVPEGWSARSVREREPLVEWYRKSAQAANTNDVIIRFERKNGGERSTAGYFDLKDVPLLKAYLEDRVPAIVSSNQH